MLLSHPWEISDLEDKSTMTYYLQAVNINFLTLTQKVVSYVLICWPAPNRLLVNLTAKISRENETLNARGESRRSRRHWSRSARKTTRNEIARAYESQTPTATTRLLTRSLSRWSSTAHVSVYSTYLTCSAVHSTTENDL